MTTSPLPAALHSAAEGICTLEAATELVIAHGTWLAREFQEPHLPQPRDSGDRLGNRDLGT
jgi:hypothetical protein